MSPQLRSIRKRDGRLVAFDPEKVAQAALKATRAVGPEDQEKAENVAKQVASILRALYKGGRVPTVENVQDLVETILMEDGYVDVAKAYILYREQHAKLRKTQQLLSGAVEMVESYLGQHDWRIKENSNMSYSLQGLNNHIFSIITSNYWLNQLYPAPIREAHEGGDFHIHDLGLLAAYCCGWDLKDLLTRGFRGVFGKVESLPPKHLRTALGQIINFFYTLQGETAGAQAFSNFDTLLAPFIRYDGLDYEQVRQAMQEFIFNINVPTRVGFQTPFTNLTMDLVPPKTLGEEAVIIGGEPKETKYKEFQKEMDLLNRAFCEVMMEGDAKGRIFTFPIPTYNITKEFDWENSNLDLLWKMTARYGVPYFSNFINSDMDPEDTRSMCCRLRLDNRELHKRGGGLFGANPLTGSIGVVTLNMARLGYLARSEKDFFERLERLMDLARESLEIKRKILERFTGEGLYPYTKYYLSSIEERLGSYWKNHFSTIGLNGVNEACLNLLKKDIASEPGRKLAIKTLNFMRKLIRKFQEETGDLYNLEATPAEGTGYRLAKTDKEKYPQLIQGTNGNGNGKSPDYTNSTHLSVSYTDDLFKALSHQDELQTLYTGGTVFHGFLGEKIDDANGCKLLVKRIAENFHLPYYTLTPTFSICPTHGYLSGEQFKCPTCGQESEVYSRVVGYYRPVQQWNEGKQAEFKRRKVYRA